MNRIGFFLVTVIVIPLQVFSQGAKQTDYEELLAYFAVKQEDAKSITPYIPIELITKFTGDKNIIGTHIVSVRPQLVFETDNNSNLIVEYKYPEGGYSSSYAILSFERGIFKNEESIGSNSLDNEGGRQCNLNKINDSVLEVKSEIIKYSKSDEEIIVSGPDYEYFVFDSDGYHIVSSTKISEGRLYPQVSIRVFETSELSRFGKNELDIMRNEIFADHGYIFKSKKWKEYYAKQEWYYPCYDDVLDFLTVIEEINIERILKIAPL